MEDKKIDTNLLISDILEAFKKHNLKIEEFKHYKNIKTISIEYDYNDLKTQNIDIKEIME